MTERWKRTSLASKSFAIIGAAACFVSALSLVSAADEHLDARFVILIAGGFVTVMDRREVVSNLHNAIDRLSAAEKFEMLD
jgi:hypothetical protein